MGKSKRILKRRQIKKKPVLNQKRKRKEGTEILVKEGTEKQKLGRSIKRD